MYNRKKICGFIDVIECGQLKHIPRYKFSPMYQNESVREWKSTGQIKGKWER